MTASEQSWIAVEAETWRLRLIDKRLRAEQEMPSLAELN
jgi:hypothetical protein